MPKDSTAKTITDSPPQTPPALTDWKAGGRHLCRVDPVLKKIIAKHGPCPLQRRKDYFVALCRAILAQQVSTIVARIFFKRLCDQFPRRRPTPQRVIDFLKNGDPQAIKSTGISRQKQTYLLDLAEHFASGKLKTARFAKMNDEDLIAALDDVRGIGRWTAEMFLIFVLNRPDVYPVDDLGLRKGAQKVFGLKELPTANQLHKLAEHWKPHRSLATWYLWRAAEQKA
jgi:DNA-3-methyladenine glycosylase II